MCYVGTGTAKFLQQLPSALPISTWFPQGSLSFVCDEASVSSRLPKPSQVCLNVYTNEFACARISWNRCCQTRCAAKAHAQLSFLEFRCRIHLHFSRVLQTRKTNSCLLSLASRVPGVHARTVNKNGYSVSLFVTLSVHCNSQMNTCLIGILFVGAGCLNGSPMWAPPKSTCNCCY